jgi:hypothetical protein
MPVSKKSATCEPSHVFIYIQFPSIMQLFTFTIWSLTQQVLAADGHLQVFHYAKPATLHLVLSNLFMCLNILFLCLPFSAFCVHPWAFFWNSTCVKLVTAWPNCDNLIQNSEWNLQKFITHYRWLTTLLFIINICSPIFEHSIPMSYS